MPLKSKAQLRKFGALVKKGEISPAKFKEWRDETPNIKELPERAKKTLEAIKKRRKSKGRNKK